MLQNIKLLSKYNPKFFVVNFKKNGCARNKKFKTFSTLNNWVIEKIEVLLWIRLIIESI